MNRPPSLWYNFALMAVIEEQTSIRTGHVRPFDIRRDLNPVADLVEMCFAETLDEDGQRYLRQMRDAARNPTFLRWAGSADTGAAPMAGFVWIEDGRLVGNLSIIPFTVSRQKYFLIANVAVHPEYRRRGIARALTVEAREYSIRKKVYTTWLHVREENQAARSLYESEGFVERARRTTWHSLPGQITTVHPPPGLQLTARRASTWRQQEQWLYRIYPPELTWQLPLQIGAMKPGLLEMIAPWLSLSSVRHWAAYRGEDLLGVVSYQPMDSYADTLWLAAPEIFDTDAVGALLSFARRKLPGKRPLGVDFTAHLGDEAFRKAGFWVHQTLVWMENQIIQR